MRTISLTAIVLGFLLQGCGSLKQEQPSQSLELLIGTFSEQGSGGVYSTALDLEQGSLSEPRLILDVKAPTYLAQNNTGVAYAALRTPGGQMAAFVPGPTRTQLLNALSTEGDAPCYVSINKQQTHVASANYQGGNVTIFALAPDGSIQANPKTVQHYGKSVHPERQTAPHPHWVEWSPYDDQILYVVDLGLDKVMMYNFDAETGEVDERKVAFESTPGAGPRHMVFHPNREWVYIVNELANTVTLAAVEQEGTFRAIQETSTLPAGYAGHNQAAHIAISKNGKYLYVSNRGLDSVAIFNLAEDGTLELRDNVPSGGKWPRFFQLLDDYGYLLVANRHSNEIRVMKVLEDGGLQATDHVVSVSQPTYVAGRKKP